MIDLDKNGSIGKRRTNFPISVIFYSKSRQPKNFNAWIDNLIFSVLGESRKGNEKMFWMFNAFNLKTTVSGGIVSI